MIAVVPLASDVHPVTTKDRLGCEESTDLFAHSATQNLAFYRQVPALVIGKHGPFLAEFFFEQPVLGSQILDDLLLLTIHPAGEDDQQNLPSREGKVHGSPDSDACSMRSIGCRQAGVNGRVDRTNALYNLSWDRQLSRSAES